MPYQMCKPVSLNTPEVAQKSTQDTLPSPDFTWNMSAPDMSPPLYPPFNDYTGRVESIHQQLYQLPLIFGSWEE